MSSNVKSEEPERLSREDSARWYMATPENPMVIGALLLFDQRLPLEALEDIVGRKLVPHRRLLQHVVEPDHRFGRPFWRNDLAFEIREHVQKLNLPEPVDAAALVPLANERIGALLPLDRSPWCLELVDLAGAGSALIARFHHCLADGRALVSLLGDLAGELGDGTPKYPAAPKSFRSNRSRGFWGRVVRLSHFIAMSADPTGPLRRPLSGEKRVAWSASIPIDTVKSIARSRNHHVADILLAGVAGALHRYSRAHGQAPQPVRALLPMVAPGASPGAELGNHYASVFLRLPIANTDARARLEIIARDMDAQRSGGELRMAIGLTKLAGAIAPPLERWAVRRWARRASLVVSDLAGPPVPVHIAGCRVQSIVVWAPAAASVGLSVTFFGYAGALRVGVLADSAVIDRPEELVAAFQAAIDELHPGALCDSP